MLLPPALQVAIDPVGPCPVKGRVRLILAQGSSIAEMPNARQPGPVDGTELLSLDLGYDGQLAGAGSSHALKVS